MKSLLQPWQLLVLIPAARLSFFTIRLASTRDDVISHAPAQAAKRRSFSLTY